MPEKSWVKAFSDHIFSNINEMIFSPLYSEKTNSKPNAPIHVIVGVLILKELTGLTEDDILEEYGVEKYLLDIQEDLRNKKYRPKPVKEYIFQNRMGSKDRWESLLLETGLCNKPVR